MRTVGCFCRRAKWKKGQIVVDGGRDEKRGTSVVILCLLCDSGDVRLRRAREVLRALG